MILTRTEELIILKFYDICYLSLSDEIFIGRFYSLTSKNYLWKSINSLQKKGVFESYIDGRKKYVYLTSTGKILCKALVTIREL